MTIGEAVKGAGTYAVLGLWLAASALWRAGRGWL